MNDGSRFLALAGYSRDNRQRLEPDLRPSSALEDAKLQQSTRFGDLYETARLLTGRNGAELRIVSIRVVAALESALEPVRADEVVDVRRLKPTGTA